MSGLYAKQRAMRARRQAALQRGLVAVIDIGTTKIACLILRLEGGHEPGRDGIGALAGQAGFRVIGAATTRSRGVRFGEVETMRETERAIRTAVQAAQRMAGVRVDHAIVAFAGGRPRSYGVAGQVALDGAPVAETDVASVLAACDFPDYGHDREALHAQPVAFALDHRTGLSDPRGQVGNMLAVDLHLLTADLHAIEHVCECLRRCDLEVAGIASAPYVSGLSTLVEDERELGAACVDMGGGTTSVSIFFKGHMVHGETVRLGGEHVTSDIAQGLGIDFAQAERIKTRHGGVVATGVDDRDIIELSGPEDAQGWAGERRSITRSELIGVIRPRVEEILEEVRDVLYGAGFEHLRSQRIALVGGASQIVGIEELAARILGQNVRVGRPMRIPGLPQATAGPAFGVAVGLSLFAVNPQDEWWDFDIPAPSLAGRSLRRVARWFRDNW